MTLFEHILIESRVDDFKKMLSQRFSIDYVQKRITLATNLDSSTSNSLMSVKRTVLTTNIRLDNDVN